MPKPMDPKTLEELAAKATPGIGRGYAKKFVETKAIRDLQSSIELTEMEKELNARSNTKGRVPPIPERWSRAHGLFGEWISDTGPNADLFGHRGLMDRLSGNIRGETVLSHVGENGVVFRTDCLYIPEMWIEATIPWEVMEEAMSQRPEKRMKGETPH